MDLDARARTAQGSMAEKARNERREKVEFMRASYCRTPGFSLHLLRVMGQFSVHGFAKVGLVTMGTNSNRRIVCTDSGGASEEFCFGPNDNYKSNAPGDNDCVFQRKRALSIKSLLIHKIVP